MLLAAATDTAPAQNFPTGAGQADRHHRRGRRARRHRAHRRRRPVAALGPAGVRHQSSGRGRLDRHEGRRLLAAGRLHAAVRRCRRASSRCRRSPRTIPTISSATSSRSASSASSRWRSRCRPSLGVNTLGELIDYVKKRPGRGQRRGAEPRRHPASDLGVDQARGGSGVDLDQLSRHAGRPLRRHGRPRAGDHGRAAEPRRRDQRRPAQAHRGRLGEAPAEPARDADHRRDAAGNPARARLVCADGAARHAASRWRRRSATICARC